MIWKYCQQCKKELPFLNDEEFSQVRAVYHECLKKAADFRREHADSGDAMPTAALFEPVRLKYSEITAYEDLDHSAILHHSLAKLGDYCPACEGKFPPESNLTCPSCGWERDTAT